MYLPNRKQTKHFKMNKRLGKQQAKLEFPSIRFYVGNHILFNKLYETKRIILVDHC